ncbi:MAG TPA: FAD-binding oxidoreductase [Candidatus Paceibacterota bacterium]|nr:FAD-binding oxidoreductase [Candidatus Paceibacterota bacterium]
MKDEILKFWKGDADDSEETLKKYSHDASIFDVRPKLVLFPKDSDDVKALVKWVNENKERYPGLSITARSAGTDMSGGAVNDSIILDFTKYMNKLVKFEGEEITVQPGMFYRDFEKLTLERGLILPCFTASKSINAMGGMFGNNSAGEETLRYGKTEDYVTEAKIIFADGNEYVVKSLNESELQKKIAQNDFEGNVYKNIYELIQKNKSEIDAAKPDVHKNSSGYYLWNVMGSQDFFNLNKLLVGSQGTLCIATEITFRLIKPKAYTKLLVVFLRDVTLLPGLVNKILKYSPQTLESYDDKTFMIVLKYIRSFAKLLGARKFFKLIFSFGPETAMTLRHGFPKIILLVEFTGDTLAEAEGNAKKAMQDLRGEKKIGLHIARDDFEAEKYWTIRRQAFNLIRYHLKKMKSEPFVDDVIVRPEKLPQFYPALYKILNQYGKEMTFAVGGHSGEGNMHIYTLLSPADPELGHIVMRVSEQVYDLVIRLGGSITAEHNDGLIRTPFLEKMYGPKITALFAETKKIFDPKNIFNPGKKVPVPGGPGTKEYIAGHITRPEASGAKPGQ